jgi:hypothetical protein
MNLAPMSWHAKPYSENVGRGMMTLSPGLTNTSGNSLISSAEPAPTTMFAAGRPYLWEIASFSSLQRSSG